MAKVDQQTKLNRAIYEAIESQRKSCEQAKEASEERFWEDVNEHFGGLLMAAGQSALDWHEEKKEIAPELSMNFEAIADHVVQMITDDPDVQLWCDIVARGASGTLLWSDQVFEAKEGSYQYELYWSWYAATQVKLVNAALVKLGPMGNIERSGS